MKPILLIMLSLFVYQIRCADFDGQVIVFAQTFVAQVFERIAETLCVKRSDTIERIISQFYDQRKSCNRIPLKINKFPLPNLDIDLRYEQTVDETHLLYCRHPELYIRCPLIDVTCRTMTGKSFKAQWSLFTTATSFAGKLVHDQLLDVQDGYTVKFIHNRAGKLSDDICADQVTGLLEDPNLMVIVEPI